MKFQVPWYRSVDGAVRKVLHDRDAHSLHAHVIVDHAATAEPFPSPPRFRCRCLSPPEIAARGASLACAKVNTAGDRRWWRSAVLAACVHFVGLRCFTPSRSRRETMN